ncbi:MAG: uracil phosphoribosyltransferase [Alphaproteobacteria bacterium]|nr:MAG: uracil phosphoribosyltransferase [Alphaproteobacteria bacterium]
MKQDPRFPNLHIVDHPLVQHKLSHMRDVETSSVTFRQMLREISLLMGYEITRNIPMTTQSIKTPLAPMQAPVLAGQDMAIISVLRAGLGMAEGLRELMPQAREGHIGIYRDHDTKKPVEYYIKLPIEAARPFFVCDPMLATGYSAIYAVDVLNKHGIKDEDIRFLSLVAAPEGVTVFQAAHPKVPVYTASLDTHLNENAYIVPGLGDAGDRIFGTK